MTIRVEAYAPTGFVSKTVRYGDNAEATVTFSARSVEALAAAESDWRGYCASADSRPSIATH